MLSIRVPFAHKSNLLDHLPLQINFNNFFHLQSLSFSENSPIKASGKIKRRRISSSDEEDHSPSKRYVFDFKIHLKFLTEFL